MSKTSPKKTRFYLCRYNSKISCFISQTRSTTEKFEADTWPTSLLFQFHPQKKPEYFIQIRSNETLSECIRPFIFYKGERYARLLQQLYLSVQTDQLNSKERILTSLPSFPTNSLWIRAKFSFSLLLLVLSTVSTCCTEYIVGFNNILNNASKCIVKSASLFDFFFDVALMHFVFIGTNWWQERTRGYKSIRVVLKCKILLRESNCHSWVNHHFYTTLYHCYRGAHPASLLLRDSYCITVDAWHMLHYCYCVTHMTSLLMRDSSCITGTVWLIWRHC